ncbi:MAG: hypothetical protein QW622_03265 [Candidatus Pacearchaeota archaeon]
MELKKLEKKELRKALVAFISQESIGGNAGPNRACANAIVDKEGNILGFSNYPEERKGYEVARIIMNYENLFERIEKEYKQPVLIRKLNKVLSKIKKSYNLPYVDKIIYEGPNKEKVIKNIEKALEEAGYRKRISKKDKF